MELRQHTEQPVRHTLSPVRFPALGLAMLALLFAAWYGFIRLGWRVSTPRPELLIAHGPLMIGGFLGTLITVERSVALGRRVAYIPPLLTGLGAAALIAGLPLGVVRVLLVLGSAGLVAIFAYIVRQHPTFYTLTMAGGAVAWFLGNVLWAAGLPVFRVVLWWMGFLVLTIAGERLELSRVMRIDRRGRALFAVAVGVFVLGTVLSHALFDVGSRVAGVGLAATGLWLLRYDIATRTVRRTGLTRFIAVCLLAGYAWLTIGGLMLAAFGGQVAGLLYDAILHSIFLGFVFTVIFGHAPIIFPSVLGARMDYHPRFYTHLALLHVSLLLRVAADLAGWVDGRLWGGLVNIIAVLLFVGSTGLAIKLRSD
ncbi:MAG TPA: hypothetical protein PK801_09805 [Aggregatilineales bacterium]|nr:hypothetical protein [Chloroflexota bacterium]HOA22986.1 hypothetical protein [Aggregatilineales bacterium]HPV07364.1 hypothetical protein [Aggregatilineales bacterium]HQA68607.1 hypothetical protein [Aggregatilineales bacterium]HQE18036.1 hypothetical protein [Aggregatilineales bacterium]